MCMRVIGLAALCAVVGGCPPETHVIGPTVGPDLVADVGGSVGREVAEVLSGAVTVQIVNGSGVEAYVRVSMRVAGKLVHRSERRLAADEHHGVIGPDRADSVLVEVTLLGAVEIARPPKNYFLGDDFASGETIVVEVEPEPEPEPKPAPDPDPEPDPDPDEPTPLTVTVQSLAEDVRVAVGSDVQIEIVVGGDRSTDATLSVFAEPTATPNDGDEIVILSEAAATDIVTVSWTVLASSTGQFRIYAEITDGDAFVRSALSAGRLMINAPPLLTLDSPRPEQLVSARHDFTIAWAGVDPDDDARITIFVDSDDTYQGDGSETIIRTGISEDDVADREQVVAGADFEPGIYYAGGIIEDSLESAVAYIGPFEITGRFVGRFSPEDLDPNEIGEPYGGFRNVLFGASIDCSRSLNGSVDEVADVLIGDPAFEDFSDTSVEGEVGAAYLFLAPPDGWPPTYTIDDAAMQFVGEGFQSGTGTAVALIDQAGLRAGLLDRDLLIGAPDYVMEVPPPGGKAYLARGSELLNLIDGGVHEIGVGALSSSLGAQFYGEIATAAGRDVAAIGDLDGSGFAEFAVGASSPAGDPNDPRHANVGHVYVFFGGQPVVDGPLGYAATLEFASFWDEGDLAGHAIRHLADVDNDERDELAIGAPRGSELPGPHALRYGARPGRVYVIFGEAWMAQGSEGPWTLGEYQPGFIEGRIFLGENDGDEAGFSLASGDFDGDGRPDLAIGAPGFDNNRGRVYVAFDVGNGVWPAAPTTIDLGLVGTTYPGVIFDGLAVGGRLGHALAGEGDFDDDDIDDLLMGAPEVESQRGAAYLVYGNTALQGAYSLTALGTRDLGGWELVGDPGEISRLGYALSSGNVNGDDLWDAGIGAPGDYSNTGKAYLLYGQVVTFEP